MTGPERRTHRRRSGDVRYALMMIVALVATWAAFQAHNSADDARSALAKQTQNRASNVAVWCDAINQQGEALIAYVAVFAAAYPGVPPLRLTHLPCKALEQKTLQSTRP